MERESFDCRHLVVSTNRLYKLVVLSSRFIYLWNQRHFGICCQNVFFFLAVSMAKLFPMEGLAHSSSMSHHCRGKKTCCRCSGTVYKHQCVKRSVKVAHILQFQ